jgi:hypothetical protein
MKMVLRVVKIGSVLQQEPVGHAPICNCASVLPCASLSASSEIVWVLI